MDTHDTDSAPTTTPPRPETRRKAEDNWAEPTANEIRTVLALAELNHYQAGLFLGLSVQPATENSGNGCRTIRRWLSGDSKIPYAAWALLCDRAGLGQIWR